MNKPPARVRRATYKPGSPTYSMLPSTVLSDPTPLIDRERELETVRAHLLSESVRLVTLTGTGGIGKTRLALAVARYVERVFRDGVWFVDLSPLSKPAVIDAAIAQALKLEDALARSPEEQVTGYLRNRHLLLVLDNFEHLLPAAARVAELLAAAPQLKVLVTSRAPLNLRQEYRFPLGGLALPDLRAPNLAAVEQAPSAALFLEHARRLQPDFGLTPADAHALADLLHRLDGVPLAIRIAAAHSHVLSPSAMLARFRGQALLSMDGAKDVPIRHHTLRRAMEWSYGLLDANEQAAFRKLSVFVGGWTLDAAEAVLQERAQTSPGWATLGRLVDKSLVQADAIARHERRYRMLQPVREFALTHLQESGELDAAQDQHACYYLALAEQAEQEWYGPEEATWLRRMEQEHENIRAVLMWADTKKDGQLSLRLAGALADFWWIADHLREGRRWLEQALALSLEGPPTLRTKALVGAGILVGLMGHGPAARGLLQQALELSVGDPIATARALTRLGMVAMYEDDARDAQALLERSLTFCRESPPRWQVPTLLLLGVARMHLGKLDEAEATFMEGLDLSRAVGNTRLAMTVTSYLAQVKLKRGDDVGAAALVASALMSAKEVVQTTARWVPVGTAALVSAHRGDFDRAVRLLAAMDGWSRRTGHIFLFGTAARQAREEIVARAHRKMRELAYERAAREGAALSADDAVGHALAGFEPRAPSAADRSGAPAADRALPLLSDRERTVLRLVGEGLPNKQIATALTIAERTVKQYVTSAMNKLGADNRAQAVVAAIQRGLL
jgi:predicted ATPase/DNA-binding CsgD family transcriptional regulator